MDRKTDIKTATGRGRLAPRNDPNWLVLFNRAAIGFRKTENSAESWVARWREPKGGKKHYHALGTIEQLPTFTLAKREAEAWFKQMDAGASHAPSRGTVRDALAAYLRNLRDVGRKDTAWEAGQRFRLTVPRNSKFGTTKLEDLTREDTEKWRKDLKKTRANRSVNRQVRAVVAGLNYAVDHAGHIGNKRAWKLQQLIDDAEAATPVFLSAEQRDRLIAAAPPALAALLTGYSHTGSRPSELAAATVADFNPEAGTVSLRHRKGRGGKVRARAVQLSDAGIEFFKQQCKGKLPKAPLVSNDAGKHFTDQQWCGQIEKAVKAAGAMPEGVSAYSFRHSRISELLQNYGVDPLTVAAQCGTSIAMIEKFYYSFISSSMKAKLNAVRAA
jgi:integrase